VKLEDIADGPNGMNPRLPPALHTSGGSKRAHFEVFPHVEALLGGVKLSTKGSRRRDRGHTIKKTEAVNW
jgi:hypothetical protein